MAAPLRVAHLIHPAIAFKGHTNSVWSVAFSPDGLFLASGSFDSTAKLWDVKTGECVRTLQGHTCCVLSVAFWPNDGAYLATGSEDETAKLWDVNTGRCVCTLEGHTKEVTSVAFSPDGFYLATGSEDETAKLWDVNTGRCVCTLEGHILDVKSVAFSPDGLYLATGSEDQTTKLWAVWVSFCGTHVRTLSGHALKVISVAFSPDGLYLATGSTDTTTKLEGVKTGECVRTLQGHTHFVNSVAFSPDGVYLATGSYDNTAKLWDVKTGRCVRTLEGHTFDVKSVAFSPDGLYLATGSVDTKAKLWDVKTGECVYALQCHTQGVYSVAFSPDGRYLATGSNDRTAKLWDMRPCLPPPPPIPTFFEVLEKSVTEKWSSLDTLDKLGLVVSDVTELCLFYTTASAARALGEIDEDKRKRIVDGVLAKIPTTFKFDQEVPTIKRVLEKARADDIIDDSGFNRLLDQVVEIARVSADSRFAGIIGRLEHLRLRVDAVEDELGVLEYHIGHVRYDSVYPQDYASSIDVLLDRLKSRLKNSDDREAAASVTLAILCVLTLGTDMRLGGGVSALCDRVLANVVDFTDAKHILDAICAEPDLAEAFARDKLRDWVDKPLDVLVAFDQVYDEHALMAALVQTTVSLKAAVDDAPVVPVLSAPSSAFASGASSR